MIVGIVVEENALRIVCLAVKVLVMAIAVELAKEIVKVIAWGLVKPHVKAVVKTLVVEVVQIHVQVVPRIKQIWFCAVGCTVSINKLNNYENKRK